jgi:hypothetical protein
MLDRLTQFLGRRVAVGAVVLLLAAGFSAPAQADTPGATSGALTMVSEPGSVGYGLEYNYSTPSTLFFARSDGSAVNLLVRSSGYEEWWYLNFAPPAGERLVPATYEVDSWFPFRGDEAGLEVSGNGQGCGPVVGSFTVLEVEYGPSDTIQRFHATFVERCAVDEPALRGEIHLVNHPWRAPLEVSIAIDPDGSRMSGDAQIHGTITCNVAGTTVALTTAVSQDNPTRPIYGDYREEFVPCEPTGSPWSRTIESFSCRDHPAESGEHYTCDPFLPGAAEVYVNVFTSDPTYGFDVDQSATSTVQLTRR